MVLHISQLQYQRIQEALEAAYPQEGCGVLVGKRVLEPVSVDSQDRGSPPPTPQEAYREVVQVVPVTNAWEPGLLNDTAIDSVGNPGRAGNKTDNPNGSDIPDPSPSHGAHDRYWIDPADLLRIQKEARDQDLEIIGIFHSHPDHPALPSECDRRLAWPVYSYLIASVRGGQVADVQSWRLNDAQQFEPEVIKILGSSANNPLVLA
ncbi:MAG: Mov34/MPN/PAD-1 family protein [Spirulina sp.]